MTVIRRLLSVGLFVALLASGWSFAAGNDQTVAVDYLFGTTEALPVWLVVGGAWTLGVGLSGVYLGLALLKDRVEIRRLHRAIRGLEAELRDFRNKPIHDTLAAETMIDTATGDALPPAASSSAGGGR